jgi:hypothetical protein
MRAVVTRAASEMALPQSGMSSLFCSYRSHDCMDRQLVETNVEALTGSESEGGAKYGSEIVLRLGWRVAT